MMSAFTGGVVLMVALMAVPHVVWAGCSYAAPQPVAAERLRLKQRIATSDDRVSTRPRSVGNHPREVEYPSFDGFYNNLGQPDLGGHDLPLKRYLRPAYADGVQALSNPNGPNPRLVSMRTMAGAIGTMSQMNRTVMLTHYGQHIVEELVNAMPPQCTTEYINIHVEKDDPEYGTQYPQGFINLRRARYDLRHRSSTAPGQPREQLTLATPWIDGSVIYGDLKAVSDALRSFSGGRLAESRPGFPARNNLGLPIFNQPPPVVHELRDARRQYLVGAPGVVENPVLMSMGILWFRNHNWHADRLAALNPTWADEELFFEARKWVVAEQQKITLYDWLPAFLGTPTPAYTAYDPSIDPRVSHVFQSAAQRWGHTLVTPGVYRRNKACEFRNETNGKPAFRICNSYFEPNTVLDEYDNSIEELWLGMTSQLTENEDNIITPDLQSFVFGPLEASRRDLMAINIQRSREHGLPSYNVARTGFGLAPAVNFTDITSNATLAAILKEVHNGDIDTVDIWTGGLLETTDGPGPLFTAVILDQYTRVRNADRFWYENPLNELFLADEIATIQNTTLHDIIVRVSRGYIGESDIADDVFHHVAGDPCPMPAPLAAEDLDECTEAKTFDFYSTSDNDIWGILVGTVLALVAILAAIFYVVARQKSSKAAADRARYTADTEHGNVRSIDRAYVPMAHDEMGSVALPPGRDGAWPIVVLRPGGTAFAALLEHDRSKPEFLKVYPAAAQDLTLETELRRVDMQSLLGVTKDSASKGGVLLRTDVGQRTLWFVASSADAKAITDLVQHHRGDSVTEATAEEMHRLAAKAEDEYLESISAFMDAAVASIAKPVAPLRGPSGRGSTGAGHAGGVAAKMGKSMRSVLKAFGVTDSAWEQTSSRLVSSTRTGKSTRARRDSAVAIAEGEESFTLELDLELFSSLLGVPPSAPVAKRLYAFVSRNSRTEGGGGKLDSASVRLALAVLLSTNPDDKVKGLFDMYAEGNVMTRDGLAALLAEMAHWGGIDNEAGLEAAVATVADEAAHRNESIDLPVFSQMMESHPVLSLALESNGFGWSKGNLLHKYASKAQGQGRADGHAKPTTNTKAFSRTKSRIGAINTTQRNDKDAKQEANGDVLADVTVWANRMHRHLADRRRELGFLFFFFATTALIFLERYWSYSDQRLHGGLRAITNRGVAVTRGGASAMMWTFSLALLPMCRNLMTALRSTFLIRYVPFDQSVAFHKIAAITGGLFIIVHIVGHVTNFYKVSTTPAANMECVLREVYWYSDFLPSFAWWFFRTVTGVTGYILLIVSIVMFVFASPWSRRFDFNLFWTTHQLYVVFYALMIAHGSAHLVQQPIFWQYFVGPLLLYTIDKLITLSHTSVTLEVKKARILPGGVLGLYMEKPPGFNEVAGQWVRLRISVVSNWEWHPFTISSAPHEPYLSVHIRGVGPWTRRVREVYREAVDCGEKLPGVNVQGPYGEGYQEWIEAEVCVLVGAGIGVTPFVSIVKDYGERLRRVRLAGLTGEEAGLPYVYFMWVAKTQRQYEWLIEICKEVEELDEERRLEVHLFLTANKGEADFRKAVAHALDRDHYAKTGVSLLTGMRGMQHVGRPDFEKLLSRLREVHQLELMRVYSCGPPVMRDNIDAARELVNDNLPTAQHIEHISSSFYN